ncbi:MAG: HNH endonuclease, partial [Butyrivibrio sp.]|nr:HNH endonuclease [Butyrivibrio sp.]
RLYNSMVAGMQNYYCYATHVNLDCSKLNRAVMVVLTNRLSTREGNRLVKTGRELTAFEKSKYGKSKMLRFVAGTDEPIYPIGYTQHKNPLFRKKEWNFYTKKGREDIHTYLKVDTRVLLDLMKTPTRNMSVEMADNRLSLYSAQWGKCAITGIVFDSADDIHCHHKIPRHLGGTDTYSNLILVCKAVDVLLHDYSLPTLASVSTSFTWNADMLLKINRLRKLAQLPTLTL